MPPDIGLALPVRPSSWADQVALAVRAEELGLASLWLSDPPPEAGPVEPLEPLAALAALARVTTRVRLGTMALHAGLRPAGVLAKVAATLDGLSDGRLTLGLARGPGDDEATVHRVVAALTEAFTGRPARLGQPRSVQQPHPPLWVVGESDELLGSAATADGWNPGGWDLSPEDYRERSDRLDAACRAVGREPATVARSVNRLVTPAELGRRSGGLAGELAAWAGLGVSTVVVAVGELPFGETTIDGLELLASTTKVGTP